LSTVKLELEKKGINLFEANPFKNRDNIQRGKLKCEEKNLWSSFILMKNCENGTRERLWVLKIGVVDCGSEVSVVEERSWIFVIIINIKT
jgi:hypothetical protein